MANTLYVAVYTSASTATWSRANLGNGRNGWGAGGYVADLVDGSIRTTDGDETTAAITGLSASTAYKVWAIVDDGSTSSNGGTPQASAEFTTPAAGAAVNGSSTAAFDLTGTATGTVSQGEAVNGSSTAAFDLTGTATGTIANPAGAPVNGSSTAAFDLTGTATGTVQLAVAGSSTAAFDLTGTATGTISQGLPVNGSSVASFDLTGNAAGTIATSQLPVNGSSAGTFDLLGSAAGIIVGDNLCPGLPPLWRMVRVLESVPNPNAGTPYGNSYFARWTYVTYDEHNQVICASGADTDCCAQAHSLAQCRTQQRPYNEAT